MIQALIAAEACTGGPKVWREAAPNSGSDPDRTRGAAARTALVGSRLKVRLKTCQHAPPESPVMASRLIPDADRLSKSFGFERIRVENSVWKKQYIYESDRVRFNRRKNACLKVLSRKVHISGR